MKMADDSWSAANTRFLGAAMQWLYGRLETTAGRAGTAPPVRLAELGDWAGSALAALQATFGLSDFETETLLLCAVFEMNTGLPARITEALGDPAQREPSFALAMTIFAEPSWDALSADRPLRAWRLIDPVRLAGQPLIAATLRCDERILDFIKGLNRIDERLTALGLPLLGGLEEGDPTAEGAAIERQLRTLWGSAGGGVLMLCGTDPAERSALARAAALGNGRLPLAIAIEALPGGARELDELARLILREAALVPLAILIEGGESDGQDEAGGAAARLMMRLGVPAVLAVRDPWVRVPQHVATVSAPERSAAERKARWIAALGPGREALAERLGDEFRFGSSLIRRLVDLAAGSDDPDAEIWRLARDSVRAKLDLLAQRIEPRAGWDDLVVPDEQHQALAAIIDQMRRRHQVQEQWGFGARNNRGLGISALFAGESGTGKTMAAEVIAQALDLNLYRVDLSAVVSKYIGETEKNLRRLFDAAELGGSILFFDEADALFGRRSEVKDSHDRYANIETNYLLQRIEKFSGLAILATNMKAALDPAFLRRLRFIVTFPYPGRPERERIWRNAFPAAMREEGFDAARLARLNLTGGNIFSAALNAAFLAAAEGTHLDTRHALAAARSELLKLDRPINEADFRMVDPGAGA